MSTSDDPSQRIFLEEDIFLNFVLNKILSLGKTFFERLFEKETGLSKSAHCINDLHILVKRNYKITRGDEVDMLIKLRVLVNNEDYNVYIPVEVKALHGDFKRSIGQALFLKETFGTSIIIIPGEMKSYLFKQDIYHNVLRKENIGLILFEKDTFDVRVRISLNESLIDTLIRKSAQFDLQDRLSGLIDLLRCEREKLQKLSAILKRGSSNRTAISSALGDKSLFSSLLRTFAVSNTRLEYFSTNNILRDLLARNLNIKAAFLLFLSIDSKIIRELLVARYATEMTHYLFEKYSLHEAGLEGPEQLAKLCEELIPETLT